MEARDNSRFGGVILAAAMSSANGRSWQKHLLKTGENTLLGQVLETFAVIRVKGMVAILVTKQETIQKRITTRNFKHW